MYSVTITGLTELEREFAAAPAQAAEATRQGLTAAGVLVEGDAKRIVHSDTNPWTGSANPYYKPPTGKLKSSIATGRVQGSGINQFVEVGIVPRGGAVFHRSSKSRTTRSNSSDVEVYGPIEERKHPYLVPALMNNAERISLVFWQRFRELVFRRAA